MQFQPATELVLLLVLVLEEGPPQRGFVA